MVLGLLALTYGPSVASFTLSFSQWDLLSPLQWVGTQNYSAVLSDAAMGQVLRTTLVFVTVTTVVQLLLGSGLAWCLFCLAQQAPQHKRWVAYLQQAFFMPYVTPMVAVALVFGWLFEGEAGLVNQVALALHWVDAPRAWLHDAPTALLGIITLDVWKSLGYTLLLVLAGLQALSPAVLEAATLDGATGWRLLSRIVLPLLAPTLWVVGLLTVIHALLAFDAVYLLTQGGPTKATTVWVFWVFQHAFQWYQAGKASALAYVLALVLVLLSLLQGRLPQGRKAATP
jgi:multiple sugar transport system permease protein